LNEQCPVIANRTIKEEIHDNDGSDYKIDAEPLPAFQKIFAHAAD